MPAAKKTASKKTAATAATTEAPKQVQQIVPALPSGWTATISFESPDGAKATVSSLTGLVVFESPDGTRRVSKSDSLAMGLRAAGQGIKALDRVAQQEKKAKEAQAAALAVLGDIEEDAEVHVDIIDETSQDDDGIADVD